MKIFKKLLIAAIFISGIASTGYADLANRVNGIINQKSQKKVKYAVKIIDANSGKTLIDRSA